MPSDTDIIEQTTSSTVCCPECGCDSFTLRRVDEWQLDEGGIRVFCDDCGSMPRWWYR